MFNNNLNDVLSKLLSDDAVAEQIGSLVSGFQDRNTMGAGGALNLAEYQTLPFKGYRFEEGGVVGQEASTPPVMNIITDLGLDPDVYERYKNLVIFHETGGTMDPTQVQDGGGPGRGLFQFESDTAQTAAGRLKTYFKNKGEEAPEFVNTFSKKGGDATTLSAEEQEMLFVGQMMKRVHGEEGLSVVLDDDFDREFNTVEDYGDVWLKNHNKSGKTSRRDDFIEDAQRYLEQNPEQEEQNPSPQPTTEEFFNQTVFGDDPEKAGLGKFFKKRFDDLKKVGKFVGEAGKGVADWGLGMLGMPDVIDDTFVDRSKFLSGANNIIGGIGRTALNAFVPGAGTAIGAIGGAVNGVVKDGRDNRNAEQAVREQQNQFNDSAQGGLQQLMQILGGNQNNPMSALTSLFSGGITSFENGGITDTVPQGLQAIQTEKYKKNLEQIILPDGMIVDVNATKAHEKMEDDEVTDVVSDGTYVASARPDMAIQTDSFRDIIFGHTTLSYDEHRQGKIPEEVTAADIIPNKKKKVLPSEYAELIKKEYPILQRDQDDFFTNSTNKENLSSRLPFIQALVTLGEGNRLASESGRENIFKKGGFIKKYDEGGAVNIVGGVQGALGGTLGVLGSVGSGIAGLVNVAAQRNALAQQQSALTTLTGNLQNLNNQGTLAGIAGQLAQQTNLPSLNLDFSRLENFDASTPQSFIDAQARPTNDINALIDRVGDRGGVAAFANQASQQMAARNAAAQNAFIQERNTNLSLAQQLTQGRNQETEYNNNLRQQEIAARNNVFNNIAGQIQGNLQNNANIQSQQFLANSELALQRSALTGQGLNALASSLVNAGGIVSSGAFGDVGNLGLGNILARQSPTGTPTSPVAGRTEILNSLLPQNAVNFTPTSIAPLPNTSEVDGIFGLMQSGFKKF